MKKEEGFYLRYKPATWHNMLRRGSRLKTCKYWVQRPIGAIVRVIEFTFFSTTILSRLFTNSALQGGGITFGRIFLTLTDHVVNTSGDSSAQDCRDSFTLANVKVDIENAFFLLHSGHVLSPFLPDRQFFGGMYLDDIRRLIRCSPKEILEGDYFVLPRQEYYAQFLTDFLPRVIEAKEVVPNIKVVTVGNQSSYVAEALDIVGIELVRTNSRHLILEKAFVAEETKSFPHNPYFKKIKRLDVSLLGPLSVDSGIKPLINGDKILISRKEQPRFDQELEKKLIESLAPKGFIVIDPREYSFAEQILIFREASVLVGFHGGAMANMVFMPEGSKVFEIYAKGYDGFNPNFFANWAKQGPHRYETYTLFDREPIEKVIRQILCELES